MEKKKEFIINCVYYMIIGVILLGICKYVLPALLPFIFAFLAAALIQIPAGKISGDNTGCRKVIVFLLGFSFYTLLFFAVAAIGVKPVGGMGELIESAPAIYQNRIVPFLEELSENMEVSASMAGIGITEQIESAFQELTQNMGRYVPDFSMKAVKVISVRVTEIPGFIVKIIVTVISTFFIAMDYDRIIAFLKKCIPAGKEDMLCRSKEHIKNTVFIYIKSYSRLFLLTFIELSIGFYILKIPYAGWLGLVIAIFDILPVLGTGGILLPWAVILFLMKNTFLAVRILVLYLVITGIRNIVEPKLVGKQIGLHPLATLIAMFSGLKLIGIAGMILFPVALAIVLGLKKTEKFHH